MTDGMPDGDTNQAIPDDLRDDHNILASYLDKESTSAYFIS